MKDFRIIKKDSDFDYEKGIFTNHFTVQEYRKKYVTPYQIVIFFLLLISYPLTSLTKELGGNSFLIITPAIILVYIIYALIIGIKDKYEWRDEKSYPTKKQCENYIKNKKVEK